MPLPMGPVQRLPTITSTNSTVVTRTWFMLMRLLRDGAYVVGASGPTLGGGSAQTGGRDYADKERIVLVMDNLDTHHRLSLQQAVSSRRTARPDRRTGR